ncbi:MAG: oligosaccharide flippase family protein [Bacteroidota bacterium]|jgi:O-antigen/teichoic acid export membrane protein
MNKLNHLSVLLVSFFTKGHRRSINAKKNIIAMFAVKSISIAVNLLLVPLTIDYVNPTRYGIWLTLSSIVAWFSFFDIGFSFSLRNRFAESKATNNFHLSRTYVSTTYASLSIIFFLVWIIFFSLNQFTNWDSVLNAPIEMRDELSKLALIIVSFFCLQIVLKTMNTVLMADQKPAKSALIDMAGQVLSLLIVYILTKVSSHSLLYLGAAIGFAPIFVISTSSIWFYKNDYKEYIPSLKFVDFNLTKDIFSLGFKFFVIQIAAVVIYQTGNVIIAQVCGPQDVTVYNIAFKYFSVLIMAFSMIVTPFWSAYTEAQAVNDYKWMNNILRKLRIIWMILILADFIFLLLSSIVYHLWIGNKVSVPLEVSIVISIYVLIFTWCAIYSQILAGLGKIKLMLISATIACLVNIPLSIYLGKKWGIVGVVSSSIILSVISGIWSPIQVNLLLKEKATGIWNE